MNAPIPNHALPDSVEKTVVTLFGNLVEWADQHPDLCCHLLFDPAMRDAQDEWHALSPDLAERRTPIALHESLFPEEQRPCFYALDLRNAADLAILKSSIGMMLEDWLPEVAQQGQGHRICGWLWMPPAIPTEDLARHLALQGVQYDLARNGRILLRYFDPRILDQLWQCLDAEQHAALFGPIRAWHFIDRTGAFKTLTPLQGNTQGNTAAPERCPFNERQWAIIKRMGLVNQTLAFVQSDDDMRLQKAAVQDADLALARAQQHHGLTEESDLIEFAYLALTRHPRFDEHWLLRPIMQAVREGGRFFVEVKHITPEQWTEISASF